MVQHVTHSLCNIVVLCLVAPVIGGFRRREEEKEHVQFSFENLSDWVLAATLLLSPFWFAANDPLDCANTVKGTLGNLEKATRYKRTTSRFLALGMATLTFVKLREGCVNMRFVDDNKSFPYICLKRSDWGMATIWAFCAFGWYFNDIGKHGRLNQISYLGVCYTLGGWLETVFLIPSLLQLLAGVFVSSYGSNCRGGWQNVRHVFSDVCFIVFYFSTRWMPSWGRSQSHRCGVCGAADATKRCARCKRA